MEELSPIFLYSGWRTGGTALAAAFKSDTAAMLFFDPLSPTLENFENSKSSNSSNWFSNHPKNFSYFENYLPLFESGQIKGRPDMSKFRFHHSSKEFQGELVSYIQQLVNVANEDGLTPIFKFEQLEGHVAILRQNFPKSLHLGVIRDPKPQYASWLEQLALGNADFFKSAENVILGDKEFFKPEFSSNKLELIEIFEIYYNGILKLRSQLDYLLELNNESFLGLLKIITNPIHLNVLTSAFNEYLKMESAPSVEFKFSRMQKRSLQLTSELDQITGERDQISINLTSELDQITGERDRIAGDRDRIAGERDQISEERERITKELTSERDQVAADRDRIAGERDQISEERERITKELTSERDQVAADRDRIAGERDQISEERERITKELTSERDQVAADRDRIAGERDDLLNSTIWRTTKPIRWFANLFKR
jgi:hypothetical protein